ncbi:MAG: hypothetical protein OXD30_09710 [Bryobacterales bacterium]|nr:hypothetical protein [Bryobacterales bacterium]
MASFNGPRSQFQGPLPQTALEHLASDRVGRPGRYEAGELVFDGGDKFLRAGFFTAPGVSSSRRGKRASASCSLTASRVLLRSRKRWYSSSWGWTVVAAAWDREREVRLIDVLHPLL